MLYGVLMGCLFEKDLRREGAILGRPLMITLSPVLLLTAPLGLVLLRFSTGWFLHGFLVNESSIFFERFHLGLMLALVASAVLSTVGGLVHWVAFRSHDKILTAWFAPSLAIMILITTLIVDPFSLFFLDAGQEQSIFLHHSGWISLGIILILLTVVSVVWRRRESAQTERPSDGAAV